MTLRHSSSDSSANSHDNYSWTATLLADIGQTRLAASFTKVFFCCILLFSLSSFSSVLSQDTLKIKPKKEKKGRWEFYTGFNIPTSYGRREYLYNNVQTKFGWSSVLSYKENYKNRYFSTDIWLCSSHFVLNSSDIPIDYSNICLSRSVGFYLKKDWSISFGGILLKTNYDGIDSWPISIIVSPFSHPPYNTMPKLTTLPLMVNLRYVYKRWAFNLNLSNWSPDGSTGDLLFSYDGIYKVIPRDTSSSLITNSTVYNNSNVYIDNIPPAIFIQFIAHYNFNKTKKPFNKKSAVQQEDIDLNAMYRSSGDPLKGLNVSKSKDTTINEKYYALIIGIDKYSGQWIQLNNAVHDAKAIEQTLREKYKIDNFFTLYDEQATRSTILRTLETLVDSIKEDDNLLIYFSGHGDFKKSLNKGFWIPYDAKANEMSELISNNDIQIFLSSIKSRHTLLISDACFSGDIFRGNTVPVPFEESKKYYTNVYNLRSRQALTSGGLEPVMDGGSDGHSVFTYYLLKNLNDNTNKYMDAGQLYNNLKVPVVNNSDQTPLLNSIKNVGDEGGQFIFIKK